MVLAARPSAGRPEAGVHFSRAVDALSDAERIRVRVSLETLPPSIGLLTLRRLVPVMAALPGQLNLLTAEAVAAAIVLDAPIAVTTDSDLLNRTATQVGVTVEKVTFDTREVALGLTASYTRTEAVGTAGNHAP